MLADGLEDQRISLGSLGKASVSPGIIREDGRRRNPTLRLAVSVDPSIPRGWLILFVEIST